MLHAMSPTKILRKQDCSGLTDQLIPVIAKKFFCLPVHKNNVANLIDHNNGVRRCMKQGPVVHSRALFFSYTKYWSNDCRGGTNFIRWYREIGRLDRESLRCLGAYTVRPIGVLQDYECWTCVG